MIFILQEKEKAEAKQQEENEQKENEATEKEEKKPGFDGTWYTDINEE